MDDLCNTGNLPLAHPKLFYQRLKAAVVAAMSESLGNIHIEWDCIRQGTGVVAENEACLRIDVTSDQPCGGNAVDSRPRPGHPGSPPVLLGFAFSCARPLLGFVQSR